MLDELMSNLSKTAILGTALLGGIAAYDEMTPPAATYFQQVQVESQYVDNKDGDDVEPFSYSKIETPIIAKDNPGVLVDLKKTPIPVPDYVVGPDSSTSLSQNNFGLVNRSNN